LQWIAPQLFPRAVNVQFKDYPPPGISGTDPYGRNAAVFQQGPLSDKQTGYLGQAYSNLPVTQALAAMKDCALFSFFGHGGEPLVRQERAACITFWTGSVWGYLVDTDVAKTWIQNHTQTENAVVIKLLSLELPFKKMLLGLFLGCCTAQVDEPNSRWGSPARVVNAGGAKCTVGFSNTIFPSRVVGGQLRLGAEVWSDIFWQQLNSGDSVRQAVEKATLKTPYVPNGLGSSKIYGDGTVRIAPARYNSP
jgi:hypothetical protein